MNHPPPWSSDNIPGGESFAFIPALPDSFSYAPGTALAGSRAHGPMAMRQPSDAMHSNHELPHSQLMRFYHPAQDQPPPTNSLLPAKFESPSLSSGSSSTPETRGSQQLVTPKNVQSLVHFAEGHGMVIEEEGEDGSDEGEDGSDEDDGYDHRMKDALPEPVSTRRRQPSSWKGKSEPDPVAEPDRYPPVHVHQLPQLQQKGDGVGVGVGGHNKRRNFLHRNRVAAMKCRKKKKEWVNDLEETKTGLESANTALHLDLERVLNELDSVRGQLMFHASCNDANIDKWIENEAKRYLIDTSEKYDQILAYTLPAAAVGGVDSRREVPDKASNTAGGVAVATPPTATRKTTTAAAAAEITTTATGTTRASAPNTAEVAIGPSLHGPFDAVPPHISMPPFSPGFYTPTAQEFTSPCFNVYLPPGAPQQEHTPHEPTPFGNGGGFDHTPVTVGVGDDDPDYDGMSMSIYAGHQ